MRDSYIKVNDKKFADLEAGTSVLIPSAADIDGEIASCAPGETLTLTELRHRLASRHGADGTCPVMCGLNLKVAALSVFEALEAGVPPSHLTPVWNAIDPTSKLATKLPGGPDRVAALRGLTP